MKIGILTFHCAYNFGALLQAYALQTQLELWNHNASILNYRPDYLSQDEPQMRLLSFIKHPFKYSFIRKHHNSRVQHYRLFKDFENSYFNLDAINSINKEYDLLIIGSDQIWNQKYNGKERIWYGYTPDNIQAKRIITYAASAGDATANELGPDITNSTFNMFDCILVREQRLQQALSQIGIESALVLDPVLMASKKVWRDWLVPKQGKEKYIVVYQGRSDNRILEFARNMASKNGWKTITVDMYDNSYSTPYEHIDLSPEGFVKIIANAACVVTSSFHGTAIAIIANTPFYSICMDDGADGRVLELLTKLSLEDRFIRVTDDTCFMPIDYTPINHKLEVLRQQAQQKLSQNLY